MAAVFLGLNFGIEAVRARRAQWRAWRDAASGRGPVYSSEPRREESKMLRAGGWFVLALAAGIALSLLSPT